MKIRLPFRGIAFVLFAAILLQCAPLTSIANDPETGDPKPEYSGETEASEPEATPEILNEEITLRSSNSKQFLMKNGMFTATLYSDEVHYESNTIWALVPYF